MLTKLGTTLIATAIGFALLPGATVAATAAPVPAPAAAEVETQTETETEIGEDATGIACTSTSNCAPLLHGGAYMVTSVNSCSAGLPVRSRAGAWYVLTAGHCVAKAGRSTWRQSNRTLGVGSGWEYAGLGTKGKAGSSDLGLIKVTGAGWSSRSRVLVVGSRGTTRSQQIITAKDARNGEQVCVTAGRSNVTRCGTVVMPATSLKYASPGLAARTVGNLALVKGVCLQPGDSGSAVFAGRAAVGIAVAKSGSGCYFWYAKVPAALARYGVSVVG